MAGIWVYIGALFVLGPIVGLLLVGLIIALRSGAVDNRNGGGLRLLASNFTWMLLRVVGYLAGLAVVQKIIGIDFGW